MALVARERWWPEMQTTVGGARCPGGRRRGRRWRSGGLYVDFCMALVGCAGGRLWSFFFDKRRRSDGQP